MSPITDLLERIEGRDVLDVACGQGDLTRLLARHIRGVRSVLGIDPDKDSIDQARRDTDDRRIRYRLVSLEEFSVTFKQYDVVSIGHAIHHVPDPRRAIEMMLGLLKPGGWFVLREPVCDGLSLAQQNSRDVHHIKAEIDTLRGRSHRPTVTRERLDSLVASLGLSELLTVFENEAAAEAAGAEGTAPPDSPLAADRVSRAADYLDNYLQYVPDSDRRRLSDSIAELKRRIALNGVAPVTVVLKAGRKDRQAG
jgi:SAM-dependent methyltransferase